MMKVMRWPLRASVSKKFKVNVILHSLEGFPLKEDEGEGEAGDEGVRVMVDVKWKGPKRALGGHFRRQPKLQRSRQQEVSEEGVAYLDEQFENVCTLSLGKDEKFQLWNVCIVVQKVLLNEQKAIISVLGTALQNLAEFAPFSGNERTTIRLSLGGSSIESAQMALLVTFDFVELKTESNGPESIQRVIAPSVSSKSGPLLFEKEAKREKSNFRRYGGSMRKEDGGTMRKESLFEGSDKTASSEDLTSDEKKSSKSQESSPKPSGFFELESAETSEDDCGGLEQVSIRNSFNYGKIAEANLHIDRGFAYTMLDGIEEDKSNDDIRALFERVNPSTMPKLMEETSSSDSDQATVQSSMRSLLSWRKRKLSFRSPRAKGEPLLNKAYGEEGGDEIDWDRRRLGSPMEPMAVVRRLSVSTGLGMLDFGESFTVGCWEHKELISRDTQMQLSADVFLASIDQRSESAAGESACTALVAVVADWMHRNLNLMPSKAEFDMMIRDGSAEWRKLCEQEAYKERFPDGHFDLDTVILAGVRPLSVIPQQSFVGFFQPEGLIESCDFLKEAMSFDCIWKEIEKLGSATYIVSWNDHFFVVKFEGSRCFLIDTLGERLHEGCLQAYILKFDDETILSQCTSKKESSAGAATSPAPQPKMQMTATDTVTEEVDAAHGFEGVVYSGSTACREFIKGFLAAIPLRDLQNDLRKGLAGQTCLHQMLQIEFHYTELTTLPYEK